MSEAETIADLAVKARGATYFKNEHGREFLVTGEGQATAISEPNAIDAILPAHIGQDVALHTVDSLVEYANRFKIAESVILADVTRNAIRVAIDYHAPPSDDEPTGGPMFVVHNAELHLPFSTEWKLWTGINARMFGHLEFARFIEENGADIAVPTGADLLEISRDLQLVRKADFRKVVRTASGDERFEYTDETTAKSGGVDVPSRFLLSLPVYFDGSAVSLYAFLRYALDDGAVKLGISLNRAENVRQAEFKRIVTDVAERTGLLALYGTA